MEVELNVNDRQHSTETQVVLRSLPAIVGRQKNADVPLRDPWASHTHCALSEMNGTLFVRDLGSKNGIHLHGHRVTEATLLPGDCFTIGRTEITVHYQRGPQTAAESPAIGTVAESGSQQPSQGASGPETRELLYGDSRDTARPDEPPEEEEASP
jgi:pSer/pThr/pTyr-binding forkhead associated (FHA) protein